MGEELRLQVFLSRSGAASRRSAAEIIKQGRVTVNGKTVLEPGARVETQDNVRLDGKQIGLEEEMVYLMLNKPTKVICSADDPEERVSVYDIVGDSFPVRLFTVGRLDYMTSGLIILTNDGDFTNILSHPGSGIVKQYLVESKEDIPRNMLEDWQSGVRIKGELYRLKAFRFESRRSVILSLVEGKNREIRNVFARYRIEIKHLHRIQYGPVSLGNLKPGKFRELSKDEIHEMLEQARDRSSKFPAKRRRPGGGKKQNRGGRS